MQELAHGKCCATVHSFRSPCNKHALQNLWKGKGEKKLLQIWPQWRQRGSYHTPAAFKLSKSCRSWWINQRMIHYRLYAKACGSYGGTREAMKQARNIQCMWQWINATNARQYPYRTRTSVQWERPCQTSNHLGKCQRQKIRSTLNTHNHLLGRKYEGFCFEHAHFHDFLFSLRYPR